MSSRKLWIFKLNTERFKISVIKAEQLEELKSLKILNLFKEDTQELLKKEN